MAVPIMPIDEAICLLAIAIIGSIVLSRIHLPYTAGLIVNDTYPGYVFPNKHCCLPFRIIIFALVHTMTIKFSIRGEESDSRPLYADRIPRHLHERPLGGIEHLWCNRSEYPVSGIVKEHVIFPSVSHRFRLSRRAKITD